MNHKVMVISAHPDDEILGVGGTLLKHFANGDKIYWIIVTGIFEDQGFSKERIKCREDEIEQIKQKTGIEKVFKLNYPSMQLTGQTFTQEPHPVHLSFITKISLGIIRAASFL